MSSDTTHAPADTQSVTVYLRVRGGAEAIAFYEKAFGAVERPGRLAMPNGKVMHAALTIGNSELMLSDESPKYNSPGPQTLGGSSVSIALMVPDVDAVVERAVAAGATLEFPVQDQFYGHRSGRIVDPFGHVWVVSTVIEEVSPEEIARRAAAWAAAP
ncbi:MAG: PhnB protein [Candidatus Eremiobacteraeota bacterium]|nr:PhnB protein [Candidatus Eremiobacteraeota bacterium]